MNRDHFKVDVVIDPGLNTSIKDDEEGGTWVWEKPELHIKAHSLIISK